MTHAALALTTVRAATYAVGLKQRVASVHLRRAVGRDIHIKQVNKAEKDLIGVLTPWLKAQVDNAVDNLSKLSTLPKNADRIFGDLDKWHAKLVNAVLPILAKNASRAAVAQLMSMGIDPRKSLVAYRVKASTATDWLESIGEGPPPGTLTDLPVWMQDRISSLVRESFDQDYWHEMTETAKHDIEAILDVGGQDGASISDMAAEIRESLGTEYYYGRARNIARTESCNCLNGARRESIDGLREIMGPDVPMAMEWLSVLASTTRDTHALLDGTPANEDGLWDLAGYLVPWPGHFSLPPDERCNCLCTLGVAFGMEADEAADLIEEYEQRVQDYEGEGEAAYYFARIKANECHDEDGKFCTTGGAGRPSSYDKAATLKEANGWAKANGAPVVVADIKTGAKVMAKGAEKSIAIMVAQGRVDPAEVPSREELESNWARTFRERKIHHGDKAAFTDLEPELLLATQNAINENHTNAEFNTFTDKHGQAEVIVRRGEKVGQAAAEWRNEIHVYQYPSWELDNQTMADAITPGASSTSTQGGHVSRLRHEYGHKLYDTLTDAQRTEWAAAMPDGDTIKKGLTSYAKTNPNEYFAEVFASGTDKRYTPGIFPDWVESAYAKQKEWLL